MNNEEYKVGLFQHNINTYEKIKEEFKKEDKVAIVHATGTGKSYIALQLVYDNQDKRIVFVVPSNGIIEHITKIIEDNPNIDLKKDFSNLELRTYQSFISLSREEIANIKCDILVLDEFHHIGAPVWGARIQEFIKTHPNIKILGMSAYTVRDRKTAYERDMANPDTNELFSRKVISRYDLCDAMIDGILPKPIYKSAYINLISLENTLEEKINKLDKSSKDYQDCIKVLNDVKRRIHEAPNIKELLQKNIKSNGKYIYFCPPFFEDNVNDIETIKSQALEWFKTFAREENIIFYTTTSDMGIEGKKNREAFYHDVDLKGNKVEGKLRVMFAINQYNEGIHAPNVDGVIMGRGTTSDIVYFEQLGRALSVRGNTKEEFDELEKLSFNELLDLCKRRDILVKDSITKEELIQLLIAPVVIDLTNNIEFIKELENNLKDRIREIKENNAVHNPREIKIRDAIFDIEIENQNLFELLRYVMDRLTKTWEDMYLYAKKYYEHHGNLEITQNFKTNDGYTYDENGINLGQWIRNQRTNYNKGILSEERIELLKLIGFIISCNELKWQKNYELAKKYYEYHGNLKILFNFKTNDGYTYDEKGINLGFWISNQKTNYKKGILSKERIELLEQIGMRFEIGFYDLEWQKNYELAKKYYEHYDNLEILFNFKTNDGYTYDENGINLGTWISKQRTNYKKGELSKERIELLEQIGMRFEVKDNDLEWQKKYELAKKYYEYHGNLKKLFNFKTNDGYTYDEKGINLGFWINTQRTKYRKKILPKERIELLEQIGMRFEVNNNYLGWQKNYELAKKYYEHYGNLEVSCKFKTNNGCTHDEKGINLGSWISTQRIYYNKGILSKERIELLEQIGMRFEIGYYDLEWQKNYELAKKYYEHYDNLEIPYNFKTNNGCTHDENGINLGIWISNQRTKYNKGILSKERLELLEQIGICFEVKDNDLEWQKKYELAKKYYEHHGNLEIPFKFKTNEGYIFDENGINLGTWISTQRTKYNKGILSKERLELLEQIGMIWNINENKVQISNICLNNNIDIEKNNFIMHKSFLELQVKMQFLNDRSIHITNENGLLHEIFSMSEIDMQEKYGINMQELLDIYYYFRKEDESRKI